MSETTLSNLWQNLLNSWGFRMGGGSRHCVFLVDPNSSCSLFCKNSISVNCNWSSDNDIQRPAEVFSTNSTWRGVGWWCGDWGWVHEKLALPGFGITSFCCLLMFHVRLCQRYMTAEWGPQQCRSGSWFHESLSHPHLSPVNEIYPNWSLLVAKFWGRDLRRLWPLVRGHQSCTCCTT